MRYRGENLVENSVNEGCRGWNLEDIAGDSLSNGTKIHSGITCPQYTVDLLGCMIRASGVVSASKLQTHGTYRCAL
jgi:hypothetical protein